MEPTATHKLTHFGRDTGLRWNASSGKVQLDRKTWTHSSYTARELGAMNYALESLYVDLENK